jgi:queuine tRNA-ribosyltransferase
MERRRGPVRHGIEVLFVLIVLMLRPSYTYSFAYTLGGASGVRRIGSNRQMWSASMQRTRRAVITGWHQRCISGTAIHEAPAAPAAGPSAGAKSDRRSLPTDIKHFSPTDFQEVKYDGFDFVVSTTATDSKARLATITTPHGKVECPNFVFCGTKAAMKGITPEQLRAEGAQIMLSNTYHLMLNPGPDVVDRCGGLQKFTNWRGPMLTDSGGYQIFSMGYGSVSDEIKGRRNSSKVVKPSQQQQVDNTDPDEGTGNSNGNNETNKIGETPEGSSLIKITEDGATFKSYIDGRRYHLTPEASIEIQQKLGADLVVVLDECTPFHVPKKYTEDSMYRSHRWAVRSLNQFRSYYQQSKDSDGQKQKRLQALYGIVQGGVYEDLRSVSCEFMNALPTFGIAIGGSLGSSKDDMYNVVEFTRSKLRNDRPIHLLGIGGVRDIFHGVRQGIDTFDCVHPTRLARHGGALVSAAYWDEAECNEERVTSVVEYLPRKIEKEAVMATHRSYRSEAKKNGAPGTLTDAEIMKMPHYLEVLARFRAEITQRHADTKRRQGEKRRALRVVRENISLRRSKMSVDTRPIEANCTCYTCKNYSRAYLHHLFASSEMLGPTLVSKILFIRTYVRTVFG